MAKFFRVATEGATVDGRVIKREHINQMAKNYDPDKYAARVWMEHFRSIMPDGPFKAYGDVKSLKTDKNDEGKVVLLAQIEPLPELKEINKKNQKLYTSVEINPNFSDSGEAYLMGLGVTDSPASVGTERLMFSAIEQEKTHLFSTYEEVDFDFSDDTPADNDTPSLLDKVKAMFSKREAVHKEDYQAFHKDVSESVEQIIEDYTNLFNKQNTRITELTTQFNELKEKFTALNKQLDTTPDEQYRERPPADGATQDRYKTDC